MSDPRRAIPAVDRLLGSEPFEPLLARSPRRLVVAALQEVQAEVRRALAARGEAPSGSDAAGWYAERVRERLAALERPSLRPVVNATGVVLHTNLGRGPLAPAALEAAARAALSYSNLEYDLEAGGRGSRYDHCAALLVELTGAEAALVVNNNAAALVLALNTLAEGREAVVSRGELVEIGGSFRVPEVMAKSGARMVEVGATNRTRRTDYERALSERTGAVVKVHRSNFRMVGFTAEVSLAELAELARPRGVPVVNDLGSGLLHDLADLGLPPEPTAGDALRQGADVVTMSGDKLLGGPQAGIVLGRRELVARMRANPLCRAFRVDKLTLAALEATLAVYRDPARARRELPALRMLALTAEEVGERAAALAERLAGLGATAECVPGTSAVGGGAYPEAALPTMLLRVAWPGVAPEELEAALRRAEPPVVGRIAEGWVVLDLRTVMPDEEDAVVEAVGGAAG